MEHRLPDLRGAIKGPVPSRFIYVHAIDYDRGGEMERDALHVHTTSRSRSADVQDCQRRGYKRTGFFEVDTGEAKDWTIRLTNPGEAGTAAR